jgi:hypothetical protein
MPRAWCLGGCLVFLPRSRWLNPNRGAADLAKQLPNPVADLVGVPLQHNFDFGVGRDDGFRDARNVRCYQDDALPGGGDQFDSGDTTQSFFLCPKEPFPWTDGFPRGKKP